jgi:hypothetical protein
MERQTIAIFGIASMIVAMIWMGYKGDFVGVFLSLIAGAGMTFLATKIELRRRGR